MRLIFLIIIEQICNRLSYFNYLQWCRNSQLGVVKPTTCVVLSVEWLKLIVSFYCLNTPKLKHDFFMGVVNGLTVDTE